jgi:hypothetical protein
MIKRGNKKAYEFSFAWVFTVFIGAAVLFFAIYAATQLVDTKRAEEEAKTGKTIGILLTPVETNLEEARSSTIKVREETRIFNECGSFPDSSNNYFGSQRISASVRSRIAEEWNALPGAENTFHNKYLFSDGATPPDLIDENIHFIQGDNEFYVFSKPLNLPFKIGDLIMLWSDQQHYCFVNPHFTIIEDIEDLGLEDKNIEVITSNDPTDCTTYSEEEIKKVCFDIPPYTGCYIKVDTINQVVYHGSSSSVNYVLSSDSFDRFPLLYAAIFSDPEIYKCQIERLGKRAEKLGDLHNLKLIDLANQGCPDGTFPLSDYLQSYSDEANTLKHDSLLIFKSKAKDVKTANDNFAPCKIF